MALRPLPNSFPFPGSLIPQSIITNYHFDITHITYSAETHKY